MSESTRANFEGKLAGYREESEDDNPYPEGSVGWGFWRMGWSEGQDALDNGEDEPQEDDDE